MIRDKIKIDNAIQKAMSKAKGGNLRAKNELNYLRKEQAQTHDEMMRDSKPRY